MKKILITRRLLKACEEKASKIFEANFNDNDELYSQSKVIEMSKGYDWILTSLTDKMDAETISKLPDSIPVMKSIKKTLDPNNIMNPGKIFDLN